MGQRTTRVNELVKREISSILHTDYRDSAVYITISRVSISPDLRTGIVFYSVIGDDFQVARAQSLLGRIGRDLQRKAFKAVVLKYSPQLRFEYDPSMAEGERVLNLLDEVDDELGGGPDADEEEEGR